MRVGVALSDPGGVLATPLVTLDHDTGAGTDLDRLVALVDEHEVVEVVVGLPRTLAGRDGPAAQAARDYAAALTERLAASERPGGREVPVVLSDERLTTVTATRTLSDRGVKGRKQRRVIDQAAAVAILQGHLDARRASRDPGAPGDS